MGVDDEAALLDPLPTGGKMVLWREPDIGAKLLYLLLINGFRYPSCKIKKESC